MLDKALLEAIQQEPSIAEAVHSTSTANTRLIDLESHAFELSKAGDMKAPREMLFCAE